MNKIKRIINIMCIFFILFSINVTATTCKSIEDSADDFIRAGSETANKTIGTSGIQKISSPILPIVQMLLVVGILVVGICMVILGIQWVMSKPSPEMQGKLKERFFALVVAAGVMFGAYTIWSLLVGILSKI